MSTRLSPDNAGPATATIRSAIILKSASDIFLSSYSHSSTKDAARKDVTFADEQTNDLAGREVHKFSDFHRTLKLKRSKSRKTWRSLLNLTM